MTPNVLLMIGAHGITCKRHEKSLFLVPWWVVLLSVFLLRDTFVSVAAITTTHWHYRCFHGVLAKYEIRIRRISKSNVGFIYLVSNQKADFFKIRKRIATLPSRQNSLCFSCSLGFFPVFFIYEKKISLQMASTIPKVILSSLLLQAVTH